MGKSKHSSMHTFQTQIIKVPERKTRETRGKGRRRLVRT